MCYLSTPLGSIARSVPRSVQLYGLYPARLNCTVCTQLGSTVRSVPRSAQLYGLYPARLNCTVCTPHLALASTAHADESTAAEETVSVVSFV